MTFVLVSTAFEDGGDIPRLFTCEGGNVSPALSWSGVPDGVQSFALIVFDPDAPDPAAPQRTWVHWVLYDIPKEWTEIAQGDDEPYGVLSGRNDWKRTGYGGPCPPIGRHRYFHKLYALDIELGYMGEPQMTQIEAAIKGHVLGEAVLLGTYQKTGGAG